MEKIKINLVKKVDDSYDIIIGKDIFDKISEELQKKYSGKKIAIITDANVNKLYGDKLLKQLKERGLDALRIIIPAGENSKSRKSKEKIEDYLISEGFDRESVIVALGGGVIGDITGFTASTFMRGIDYFQIPTTLLAMVDSSIGGKTAVDTDSGKNLIGNFYQPKKVFMDAETLSTLEKKELLNGIAEMIKNGIVLDAKYFEFMEKNIEQILSLDQEITIKAVKWSCDIKRRIVEKDEKEKNLRKLLNFGHTIGHALEKTANYKISHGEAVAIGMIVETKAAEELGKISSADSKRIIDLIEKMGFSINFATYDIKEILENTKFDKKKSGEQIKYVLPVKIGKAEIDKEVSKDLLEKIMGSLK